MHAYSSTVIKLKNKFFFSDISLPLECLCCALCNGVCINSTPEIALGDMDLKKEDYFALVSLLEKSFTNW